MPPPCKLTFDLLTLKVVFESRVTWTTSMPILVFLGLSVLDLGPMYATGRQTSDAHHRLILPTLVSGHDNTLQSAYHLGSELAAVRSSEKNDGRKHGQARVIF